MRVLVVEDSERLREVVCSGLGNAGFAVDSVGDGASGLTFARRGLYDVIVLDLMLPALSGLDVLAALRAEGNNAHVLILTARDAPEDRVRGLQAGADDYLPKPFAFEELVARVHSLVRRSYRSKGPTIEVGDLSIDTVARCVTFAGSTVSLSRREFQVLEYMARRRGQLVTRIEIEDHVYGEQNLPESNAVEAAVCNIRRKLRSAAARPETPIQTLHGVGYRLGSQSD